MKRFLASLALFCASLTGFAQQATVTATISTYAGGSARAFFISQGGGSPTINQASATINASGVFSLNAWNNSYSVYAPSQTQVIICGPFPYASTCYSALVNITSSSQNISSSFSGAPVPGGGGSSITWPASGSIVLSNTTNTPAGIAEVDGDCVLGVAGAWAAGSCGASSGVSSFSGDGALITNNSSTGGVTATLHTAAQNSVWAGPASGGAGPPSYQTAPTISAANMTSFPTLNQTTTGKSAGFTGCVNSAAGDICIWSASAWTVLTGNASGTRFLQETAAGVPSWNVNLDDGTVNVNGLTYGGSAGIFAKSFNSTDTVHNASVKFGTGSSGDSSCPTPVSGTSYLCTKSSGISASINNAAYSPIETVASLPLTINFTFNSGVAVNDAAPRILAAYAATIANCYALTTASDGTTSLTFNIFDNGTSIFSGGAQTIANGTAAGTLTTLGGLATTAIANNDKISVNITSGSSSWIFSVQCK